MTECQEFFKTLDTECDSRGSGASRGSRLRQERTGESQAARIKRLIDWESQTASPHSPGPVESDELLRMAILQGRDVADGAPYRGMFRPLVDIGLSADRLKAATSEECETRFRVLARGKNKPLYGFVDLSVSHLRSIECDRDANVGKDPNDSQSILNAKAPKARAIAVYDTATCQNIAHSEAFLIIKHTNTKPYKTLEADLLDYYKDRIKRY